MITKNLPVSNLNYSCLLHYCDRKKIDPDFLIQGTNLSIGYLQNLKGKTSWADFNKVLENFVQQVCVSEYDEVFKYAAIGKDYNTATPLVFGYFSPQIPYWVISHFLGKKLFKDVDYNLKVISSKEIIMRITVNGEHEVHPLLFDLYVYVFKYLSLLINRSEANVKMSKLSDKSAEYIILLPKRLSFFKRMWELTKIFAGYKTSVAILKDLNEANAHLESLTNELYISNEIKKDLILELKQKNEELLRSKQEKEKLISVLMHDISNPLMSATYNVKKAITHQDYTFLNSSLHGLSSIKSILEHVREYESVLRGHRSLALEDVSLDECLNEVEQLFKHRFEEKNIRLKIENNLPLNTAIKVDKASFVHSVASNIISNALKFSKPNSDVQVICFQENTNIVIKIIDNGIGMPEEMITKLFDIGAFISRIGTEGEKGSGYGLPIVNAYVSLFGGKVEVTSSQNGESCGTTFSLYLPKGPNSNQPYIN